MKLATVHTNTSDAIESFAGAIHTTHDGHQIGVLYLGPNTNLHLHSAAALRQLSAVAADLAARFDAAAAAAADPGQTNHKAGPA